MSAAIVHPTFDARPTDDGVALISDPGPAIPDAVPIEGSPAGVTISDPTDHCRRDAHASVVGGSDLSAGPDESPCARLNAGDVGLVGSAPSPTTNRAGSILDIEPATEQSTPTAVPLADVDPSPETTEQVALSNPNPSSRASSATTDQLSTDSHPRRVGVAPSPAGTTGSTAPKIVASRREYLELRTLAAAYWDAMGHRIALENRLRSGAVQADIASDLLESARFVEKKCEQAMRKAFRRAAPELAAWAKETPGIGEPLLARLIGCVGHPVIADPHHWEGEGADRVLVADDPFLRNVAKLWSYCGHGDPARRKAKGMTADEAMALGSPRAKSLVYLIAVGCMKATGGTVNYSSGKTVERAMSPYRIVYDERRAATVDREGWTDGHKHADALRITGKTILRDVWLVAGGAELIASQSAGERTTPTDQALAGGES